MLEAGCRAIEVTQEAADDYNRQLDLASEDFLWQNEGPTGRNYYVLGSRQVANSPWPIAEYTSMLRRPDPAAFRLIK
jgi:hypothetical protein